MTIGAASTLCQDLLDGSPQNLSVEHRADRACHLTADSGRVVMCLVTASGVRLPHAVLVSRLPDPTVDQVTVGARRLRWGSTSVAVTRWWRPAQPSLLALRTLLDEQAAADFAGSWSSTIGRGPGLTPYDDDVACGGLVTLSAAGHPAAAAVAEQLRRAELERRTTSVSAALLRLASDGWCISELDAYLRERAQGVTDGPAAHALAEVGHSSGRGLIAGVTQLFGCRADSMGTEEAA